ATVDRRSKELKNTNQHKNRENRIKRFSRFYVLRCFWDSSLFCRIDCFNKHSLVASYFIPPLILHPIHSPLLAYSYIYAAYTLFLRREQKQSR
ncbi:IS5/IS1182 family transposase, partial [Halalkalibacterium halodurans]